MQSAFFEYNVAVSGLNAAKIGLNVTNHNISNAATVGYSRQQIVQHASAPLTMTGVGMIGTGTEVVGIEQIRSGFLDQQYWSERPTLGENTAKYTHLSTIENDFNVLSPTSINASFDAFFTELSDLALDPSSPSFTGGIVNSGESLTSSINYSYSSLETQQSDINDEVVDVTYQINSLGQEIANLNAQIEQVEMLGGTANDLRDQRAVLIDELSIYVNVEVYETKKSNGQTQFNVAINGNDFVKGGDCNQLVLKKREYPSNPNDVDGLYDIYFENGQELDVYSPHLSGALKGLIDVRDGNGGNYGTGNSTIDVKNNTISMTDMNRTDFNPNGGTVTLVDTTTGKEETYYYDSYFYDPITGEGVFTISPSTPLPPNANNGNYAVQIDKTDNYKGIPYYMDEMNKLVRTVAIAFNEGLYSDGTNIDGVTGFANGYDINDQNNHYLFFTYDPSVTTTTNSIYDYNNMTAGNIQINPILINDSSLLPISTSPNQGQSSNDLILELLTLQDNNSLFLEGTLSDYLIGISTDLGIDVGMAEKYSNYYQEITVSIDNKRKQVSSVDLNEEMINMLKYQQIYTACSKMISVVDEIYSNLINEMV